MVERRVLLIFATDHIAQFRTYIEITKWPIKRTEEFARKREINNIFVLYEEIEE